MARPKLRRPDQPVPIQLLLSVYEFFASLKLAVVLIFSAAFALGWATFVESSYGTPAVQFGVYGTWWFAALNAFWPSTFSARPPSAFRGRRSKLALSLPTWGC